MKVPPCQTQPGAPAVETRGLTRCFNGFVAVDRLNLVVPRGQFFGFLGPNGAGKTTTLRMLTGLLAPTQGTVRVLGYDMNNPAQARAAKRRMGVLPDPLALFDHLTGREHLLLAGGMHGLDRSEAGARADELLARLDLHPAAEQLVLEYSHGMKKKLALAMALMGQPEVLFLDEPFEGVDPVLSRGIRDLLRRFVERGGTVFLTSHVLEIVEKLCSHVAIIVEGRLQLQGSLEELRREGSLEERFLALSGRSLAEGPDLSWWRD